MDTRIVEPELLDALPCDHPDARRSRRDLQWINLLMGNHRWVVRTVRTLARPADRILELGAGGGDLVRRLWREGRTADGLDLCPAPHVLPAGARWWRHDLRRFDGFHDYDVIYGNLLLHQFTAEELSALGGRMQARARLLIACEPARRRHARWFFRRCSPLMGANHVTRHDGPVSIAAGFRADELPRLLGLKRPEWTWRCTTTPRGAYHMVAWRDRTR